MKQNHKHYNLILNDNVDLKADSVYFYSREIVDLVLSHNKRSLIKIINPANKKFIIRKVRAKGVDGLNASSILLDYLSAKELGAASEDDLIVKRPGFFGKYFTYYFKHPNEEIRFAFVLFWLAILFSKFIEIIIP